MSPVRYEVVGSVATITLADEENRNALGAALVSGIHHGLGAALSDEQVRVVVLTHVGSVFCAGANLKERSTTEPQSAAAQSVGFDEVLTMIRTGPKPVVARITGAAMGGGLGLAAAADISIVAADARFGFTEVRLGVAPAIISVVCLPKMRRGDAMEAFLRGRRFDGARAAELGLVTRAVAAERVDDEVNDVIADLTRGGPNALAAAKRLVNEVPAMDTTTAFEWTTAYSAALFETDEAAEGMRAFLDKRDATWVVPS